MEKMEPEAVLRRLAEKRIPAACDVSLAEHSTFRIGGNADLYIEPETEAGLTEALSVLREEGVSCRVIGHGSNLLFADEGYRGAILSTGHLREIRREGNSVTALCGVSLPVLSSFAAKENLGGLTFACGIPGTLGGAVCMNAGAWGGEMSSIVETVRCYDRETQTFLTLSAPELQFGNRDSLLRRRPELILLAATLGLKPEAEDVLRAEMADFTARRKAKQPLSFPSAGSVFKRPAGAFAGQLIEFCGLKEYSIGGAQVSGLHAGFIINRGGATAADVLSLIAHIRRCVFDRFGVTLEPEIEYVPAEETLI